MEPYELTATQAASLISKRLLSCEELARSTLSRIIEREPIIKAFRFFDPDQVIRNARELDQTAPKSELHGLTFGVKDMIDTKDMPTTHNSPLYYGHETNKDAACVAVVRHRGALIVGKTDTVEFASGGRMAATRNPYNLAHTPGGSSSGSGAAVGDRQLQLAFGTQTGGSHIRPAAFNGIYGIKPTHGLVSREGAKQYSYSLDTIGWYGRCVDDLMLVGRNFRIMDLDEPAPTTLKGLRVGLCRSPNWAKADQWGRAALMQAARLLEAEGAIVFDLDFDDRFSKLNHAQEVIMKSEGRSAFLPEYYAGNPAFNGYFVDIVMNSQGFTKKDLLHSYDLAAECRVAFDNLFGPELDVVLTLPAPGQAPEGLHTSGDHVFNAMWTLLHAPCVAIPVGLGDLGLPLGIQLVGPRMSDARLLEIAKLCEPVLDPEPGKLKLVTQDEAVTFS
ncbi:amidase [Advenella alkanexedens]|uniref:Amidase n=1 Tax=Advenella alkanexedens TaxID=1481665 RepID=A0ABS6NQH2_9BURK|nr:amidase [Advenella alkanexedens]MBV4397870.1 amidase [Advenella alkanexedens]